MRESTFLLKAMYALTNMLMFVNLTMDGLDVYR